MDLYFSPLSCSLAVHITCLEAGVPVTLRRVDRRSKRLDDGSDFLDVAPKGAVPALRLPDGSILTETAAVLQYVADLAPATSLAPRWGTPERYRLIEWIHFVSTELHKKHLWTVFSTSTPEDVKTYARTTAPSALAHVARRLDDAERFPFVLGPSFTVADAYLFWALLVAPYGGVAIDAHPSLVGYVERLRHRPSVKRALVVEVPLYAGEAGGVPVVPARSSDQARESPRPTTA